MGRRALKEMIENPVNNTDNLLEKLILQYVSNKQEFDDYKKICDKENTEIKQLMMQFNLAEKEAGGYIAKKIVQKRENMNEEKLLEIAHMYGIPEIVKTKEYIDFDALESAIYNGKISDEVLMEIDKAKEIKEVVTLRISKIKKKEED